MMGPAVSVSLMLSAAYVWVECARTAVTYYLLNRKGTDEKPIEPPLPSAIVTNSELFKCIVSYFILRREGDTIIIPGGRYCVYAIPAFFYFVNNSLYLIGLTVTSPSDLHAAMLSKVPLTAIAHHILLSRQTSTNGWLFLLLMTVSLIIFNYPLRFETLLGPLIGIVISAISSFTSVYTEMVLKQVKVPFWKSQFWLYFFGMQFGSAVLAASVVFTALFSSGGHPIDSVLKSVFDIATRTEYLIIPLLTMLSGFVVAFILRMKDNLLKLVVMGISFPAIMLTQFIFFQSLRDTVTMPKLIGGLGLCVGAYGFNHYKETEAGGLYPQIMGSFTIWLDQFLDDYTHGIDKRLNNIGSILSIGITPKTEYQTIGEQDIGIRQTPRSRTMSAIRDFQSDEIQ